MTGEAEEKTLSFPDCLLLSVRFEGGERRYGREGGSGDLYRDNASQAGVMHCLLILYNFLL